MKTGGYLNYYLSILKILNLFKTKILPILQSCVKMFTVRSIFSVNNHSLVKNY